MRFTMYTSSTALIESQNFPLNCILAHTNAFCIKREAKAVQ